MAFRMSPPVSAGDTPGVRQRTLGAIFLATRAQIPIPLPPPMRTRCRDGFGIVIERRERRGVGEEDWELEGEGILHFPLIVTLMRGILSPKSEGETRKQNGLSRAFDEDSRPELW